MNRSAAMAPFLPLLLVLLLATGRPTNYAFAAAAGVDEPPSTSRRAVPPKDYERLEGPPAPTGGNEAMIGACFPDNGNSLLDSCLKLCTIKGYAGGHCDSLPGGLDGDCYCFT